MFWTKTPKTDTGEDKNNTKTKRRPWWMCGGPGGDARGTDQGRAAGSRRGRSVRPALVLIAGGTASGKTTLARRLVEHTGALLIAHDRYYCDIPFPRGFNFDHPDARQRQRGGSARELGSAHHFWASLAGEGLLRRWLVHHPPLPGESSPASPRPPFFIICFSHSRYTIRIWFNKTIILRCRRILRRRSSSPSMATSRTSRTTRVRVSCTSESGRPTFRPLAI